DLLFEYPGIDVREHLTRDAFERTSERETQAILRTLDDTVRAAGLEAGQVDLVCCTGGTAKVPCIAQAIEARFGTGRIRDYKTFPSVVGGLALRAHAIAREDA